MTRGKILRHEERPGRRWWFRNGEVVIVDTDTGDEIAVLPLKFKAFAPGMAASPLLLDACETALAIIDGGGMVDASTAGGMVVARLRTAMWAATP